MENPKVIIYIILIIGYIIYQVYKSIKKSGETTHPKDITAPGTPEFDIEDMLKEMRRMTGRSEGTPAKPVPHVRVEQPKPPVKTKTGMSTKKPSSAEMPEQKHYKYAKEGNRPERMVREKTIRNARPEVMRSEFSRINKDRSQERTDQKERRKAEKTRVDVVDYDEMLIEKGTIKNKTTRETSSVHFSFSSPADAIRENVDLRQAVIMSEILRRPDY